MLSSYVADSQPISVRLKFLLREAILKYISVYYEFPSPILSEPLSSLKVIPPLYDLIISTYISYKADERFTQSFENEINSRYYQIVSSISKYLPCDLPCDLPRTLLDLPRSLYNEVPYSLRSQLASAVMDEFNIMLWQYSVNEFINNSHFEKYFDCKMTIPQHPVDTLPYMLTPISLYKSASYSNASELKKSRINSHEHTISQTIWANSLSRPYIISLAKVFVNHSFPLCEAKTLSHHVFDAAARLALHRATIDGLHHMISLDLLCIIREQWLSENKSSSDIAEAEESIQGSRLLEYLMDQSNRLTSQDGSPTDGNNITYFSYII